MNKILSPLLFLVIILSSCEEQPIPIPVAPQATDGRVMLIEDLTGVNCVNCVAANTFLERVVEENKKSIAIFGIHGKSLANPITGSKYDFRYPDAAELEGSFNFVGKPSAAFNRINFSATSKTQPGPAPWQATIDAELQKPQVSDLSILTTYDEAARRVDIEVAAVPLEDISGAVNIHVIMAESHLIDAQLGPVGTIPDYEHNHVMKASLTGLQGAVLGSDLEAREIYRQDFSYTIPAEVNGEWIPENMEVIAFITAEDRNGEVQQAAKALVLE